MSYSDLFLLEAKRYGWLGGEEAEGSRREDQGFNLKDLEPQIASGGLYAPLTQILLHWKKEEETLGMKSALLHCLYHLGVPGSSRVILNEIASLEACTICALEHGFLFMEDFVELTDYPGENWWDKNELNEELLAWAMHKKFDPKAALLALVLVRQLMVRKETSRAWKFWQEAIADRFVSGICWWTFCGIRKEEGKFDIPQEARECDHAILRKFIASNYKQFSESHPKHSITWAERQLYIEPHACAIRVLVRQGPSHLRWKFAKMQFDYIKLLPSIVQTEFDLGVHRSGFRF